MKFLITPGTGLITAAAILLCACANFKPVVHNVRHFVLTPTAPPNESDPPNGPNLGIAKVVLPGYLLQDRLVIRRGGNEVQFTDNLRWAEGLEKNIQRVLAGEIAALTGSSNAYQLSWRRNEVSAEVHVTFDRFEFTSDGKAVLNAKWLITNPGAERTIYSGHTELSRQASSLFANPDEAVATLSALLGELCREIAGALVNPGN